MSLNFCSTYSVTCILKNEKADNSAIFWNIKLKIDTGAHLEDVLDSFLRFFEEKKNSKFSEIFSKKKFWTKLLSYIFIFENFENPKKKICSSINSASPHAKKWSQLKKCARDNDSPRTLFCIKIDLLKVLKVWCRYLYSFRRFEENERGALNSASQSVTV